EGALDRLAQLWCGETKLARHLRQDRVADLARTVRHRHVESGIAKSARVPFVMALAHGELQLAGYGGPHEPGVNRHVLRPLAAGTGGRASQGGIARCSPGRPLLRARSAVRSNREESHHSLPMPR